MLVAEKFIRSLVEKYGKHTLYTDGGTWYPEALSSIEIETLFTFFFFIEKFDRKSQSIIQREKREF